ncbi:MAG TPA: hypothetical protein VFU02_11515 [Polyangiaceae bacterium]|nr:hypothetical protein [Polyangiaceae bacterium]
MRRSLETALTFAFLLVGSGGSVACKSQDESQARTQPVATPSASIVVNAFSRPPNVTGSERKYVPQPAARRIPLPSGPRLAILPGKGVGPIRLGATRATIERQMDRPCDVATESLCRYISRAVDFHLTGGVVDKVVVHRRDRPAGKNKAGEDSVFGIFNGGLPPDFEVMMKQKVIMDHLGPPLRQEKVEGDNPNHTLERHYYDGMTVEYDRYDNGQMVLGGVIIEKSTGAGAATPAASSKP